MNLHPGAVDSVLINNTITPNGSNLYKGIVIMAGTITETTTWPVPPAGFCYSMGYQKDITLNDPGAVWTLQPGTIIKGSGSSCIKITSGRFMADGVTFTSSADDTLSNVTGNESNTPEHDQWEGIRFNSGADDGSTITNCIIRYAGAYNNNEHSGISISGSHPTIEGCTFNDNDRYAVYCENLASPTIHNCSFSGHTVAAVENTSTSIIVNATNNWWGANSGPYDPTDAISGPPDYNPFGAGESVSDYVEYRPWLENHPPCCVLPGDANHDGFSDISDLTFFVDFMFVPGSPVPLCMEEFDNDGSCGLDISDLTYFIDWMFRFGPSPVECHMCE